MKSRYLPTALYQFLAAQWRSRTLCGDRLTAFQDRRARRIIAHADRHAPFYHEHWIGHALDNWRALPPVDKTAMMAHFADFNTAGIARVRALAAAQQVETTPTTAAVLCNASGQAFTAGLSSGTSGERGLFLVTEREMAMWAGVILARALHGIPWRGCRVAFFLRAFSSLYAGVNSPLLQLRYFALTQPLAEVVATLNRYQPHIVVGPPSLLAALAAAQQNGALQIAPQRLIAVAEVLEPQDETTLRHRFGVPVHQIYQCTEGLLAVSCAHGQLHIQEDLVALQLEAIPNPFAPAEPTRYTPIVTDLWRTTQPIIRYRLGDLLQLSEQPCPCGCRFRVIAAIEGRVSDLCYATHIDGRRVPLFPATLRRLVLDSSAAIRDYQIVQQRDDQFQIYITTDATADFAAVAGQVTTRLTAGLTVNGYQPPTIQVTAGLPPRPATAKRRRVQRMQDAPCTL
jgi:phenylacetate-CoA ligase